MRATIGATCPLCSSSHARLERSLRRSTLVDEWREWPGLDISKELPGLDEIPQWRCENCGLVFFPGESSGSAKLYEALQKFPWYYLADKWEYGEALHDIPVGAHLCEPGCGRGDFLAQAIAARGVIALGVELNADAASTARDRQLPVQVRSLESVVTDRRGEFDVVCSFQVLEHVSNPGEHLRAAHALLKPRGRLLLGLPNTESFLGREDNPLDRPPHHVSRWSAAVVRRALPALGFRVVHTSNEPLTAFHTRSFLVVQLRTRLAARVPAPLARLILHHRILDVLEWVLLRTGAHRLFRGQTFYVLAERA